MPSESKNEKSNRLPFEPRQTKKKPAKVAPTAVTPTAKESRNETNLKAIPDTVSRRMAKRMALYSGIPTGLGMFSFFIFYWVVSQKILEIPSYVAMLVSLSLFGLGFIGLSYGIFSSSWDENRVGTRLGWQEFKTNFGRTTAAWRSGKKSAKEN